MILQSIVETFYSTALKGCWDIVFMHGVRMGGQVGGWLSGRAGGRASELEKVCLGCILETIMCKKLIRGRDIGGRYRCATSLCDLDWTFDLAVLTLSLKISSGQYLKNRKL